MLNFLVNADVRRPSTLPSILYFYILIKGFKLKITFLGTGTSQGVPVIACTCDVCMSSDRKDKRLRSSIMIELEGKRLIIDCGPDFRHQMLR